MIFTLFDLFKFVRVFYWRILLSHFCVFFGFITMGGIGTVSLSRGKLYVHVDFT